MSVWTFFLKKLTLFLSPELTALRRIVSLNSSPIILSWPATLLTSSSSAASPPGPRGCGAARDKCSFWGSRSGRGPCLLETCWYSSSSFSWSEPLQDKRTTHETRRWARRSLTKTWNRHFGAAVNLKEPLCPRSLKEQAAFSSAVLFLTPSQIHCPLLLIFSISLCFCFTDCFLIITQHMCLTAGQKQTGSNLLIKNIYGFISHGLLMRLKICLTSCLMSCQHGSNEGAKLKLQNGGSLFRLHSCFCEWDVQELCWTLTKNLLKHVKLLKMLLSVRNGKVFTGACVGISKYLKVSNLLAIQ